MTYFDLVASGGRHALRYCSEATWGAIPSTPSMTSLRHTGCGLILSKETFQSEELRHDRQITDFRHGTYQVGGDTNFELSYGEYDNIIKGAFCATFQTVLPYFIGTIAVQGTLNSLYSPSTLNRFEAGNCIRLNGTALNDGNYIVSSVSPYTLTLLSDLVTETSNLCVVTHNVAVTNSTANMSFVVERAYTDIERYQQFLGCIINSLSLSLRTDAIVTGSFNIIGKSTIATSAPLDVAPTASQTSILFDSLTGVIKEGNEEVASVKTIDINIDNNGEALFVIGDQTAQSIVLGRCNVTGTVDAYFNDTTLLNKFINETESSIELDIGSSTDDYYKIFIPRIKYAGGDTSVDGIGSIPVTLPFQALYSSTYGFTLELIRLPEDAPFSGILHESGGYLLADSSTILLWE